MERVKQSYLLWTLYYTKLPKIHKFTLGEKIDALFVETMELIAGAAFLNRAEKLPYIRISIRKMDTLKLLLMVLWEAQSLDTKKYIALSEKLDGVGKMLGGWQGQLIKHSSTDLE